MRRTAPAARARAAGHGDGRRSHQQFHIRSGTGPAADPVECSSRQAHTERRAPPGVPSGVGLPSVRRRCLAEGHDRALVADDLVARRGGLGSVLVPGERAYTTE